MLHQALAGLLKDIHRLVSKQLLFLCALGCCPGERRMFSRALLSRLSLRVSLHTAAFFWPWWVSHFLQPQRMMLLFSVDGVGQVKRDVWIPPDICLEFRPKISICLITPENLVFMDWESFSCLFDKLQMGCLYLLLRRELCLDTLPSSPDKWSAAEMVVLLKVSSLSIAQQRWNYV